jgi:probable HAF family extracellular repeat protein
MCLQLLRGLIIAIACATIAAPATAGSYSFTSITAPGSTSPGSIGTFLGGINDSGTIVGAAVPGIITVGGIEAINFNSFLLSGGVFTPINDPVAAPGTTEVQQINSSGQYVGTYFDSSGTAHGFAYTGGTYHTVDAPGGVIGNSVNGINDQGVFVSVSLDSSANPHSFLVSGGNFTPINDPNATFTSAVGINNAGDVVGSFLDSNNNTHGFLLHNGQFTTLDDPLAASGQFAGTNPSDINNLGEIVGYYVDANGLDHGFVYQNGLFTTVDDPLGVGGTFIGGVNDLGQVVGSYLNAAGADVGFVATPTVPEPGSLTLLAVTGFAVAGWRLRKWA